MKPKTPPPLPPNDATQLLAPGSQVVPPPVFPPAAGPPVAGLPVPSAGFEQTVAYVRAPPVARAKVDSLLPPGSEAEPNGSPVVPNGAAAPPVGSLDAPVIVAMRIPPSAFSPAVESRPVPQAMPVIAAPVKGKQRLSVEERDQLRFWKNIVVFGFFVVVLMVVCWWLAR